MDFAILKQFIGIHISKSDLRNILRTKLIFCQNILSVKQLLDPVMRVDKISAPITKCKCINPLLSPNASNLTRMSEIRHLIRFAGDFLRDETKFAELRSELRSVKSIGEGAVKDYLQFMANYQAFETTSEKLLSALAAEDKPSGSRAYSALGKRQDASKVDEMVTRYLASVEAFEAKLAASAIKHLPRIWQADLLIQDYKQKRKKSLGPLARSHSVI